MSNFIRKGPIPKWELVADYMRQLPDGEIATKEELAAAAYTIPDRVSSLVSKANKRIATEARRLVSAQGGYRWGTPAEVLFEATVNRPKKARAQLKYGITAADVASRHVDATPQERKIATDALVHLQAVRSTMISTQLKLSRLRPELPIVVKTSGTL